MHAYMYVQALLCMYASQDSRIVGHFISTIHKYFLTCMKNEIYTILAVIYRNVSICARAYKLLLCAVYTSTYTAMDDIRNYVTIGKMAVLVWGQ